MNEAKTWRVSPFEIGSNYRVLRDFEALRDKFCQGEMLKFTGDCYSIYDSCTGYLFSQPDRAHVRIWDVYDDDDIGIWSDLFQKEDS